MSAQKSTARRPALTYGHDQLQTLQRNTFRYFWRETNPQNGLIPDHTSLALGVGLALLIWIAGQIALIGYSSDPPHQALYLVLGFLIALVGLGWLRQVGGSPDDGRRFVGKGPVILHDVLVPAPCPNSPGVVDRVECGRLLLTNPIVARQEAAVQPDRKRLTAQKGL